ncbi:MAG TPA: hypothetical protein VII08_08995 [Myxococcales bacterium]
MGMPFLYMDESWTPLASVIPTVQFNGESYSVPSLYLEGAYRRALGERQADIERWASIYATPILLDFSTQPSYATLEWWQGVGTFDAAFATTMGPVGPIYVDWFAADWYAGQRDWGSGCLDLVFLQQIEDLAVEWFLQDLWADAVLALAVAYTQRVRIILKWANQIFRTAFAGRENARRLEFDGDFHKTLHTLDGSVAPVVLAARA